MIKSAQPSPIQEYCLVYTLESVIKSANPIIHLNSC
jgi:hypothetical protein